MIEGLIVSGLALAGLAFVVAPMLRADEPEVLDATAEIEQRKVTALTAILDLEAEHEVGKLSDADLTELRAVYENEALELIHQLDGAIDAQADPLEREIAMARQRLNRTVVCAHCGAERRAREPRCPSCGE